MKRIIRGFIIFLIIIALISIPALIFVLLSHQSFADYINNVLKIQNGDLLSFITDYFSLGVALLLGVIVFFQSQKINKLESTQFNTYIGVTNTDYSTFIGSTFATDFVKENVFDISHLFDGKSNLISSTLIFNETSSNEINLPLMFVTKNSPLIVSIQPTKVDVKIRCKDESLKKKVKIKDTVICALLGDNSNFVWHFDLFVPDKDYNEVDIHIFTTLKDQNNNKQKLKTTVRLHNNAVTNQFVLTHSETVKRHGMDLV